MEETIVNIGLYVAYGLVLIGTVLSVAFPIRHLIAHPKGFTRVAVSLGAIVLLFLISYVISGNEVLVSYQKYGLSASSSKFIGALLITVYFLLILIFASILGGELFKFFRKERS